MLKLDQDIVSMTEFKRNTNSLVRKMKSDGRPVALTVNGRAEVVVQDAASYQALLDRLARFENGNARAAAAGGSEEVYRA
jgi:prevent-host-death family protein